MLLGHQLNALQIVGDYITGKPGKRPLRSALAFHSMGSGKSALVHAILNLLLAVASLPSFAAACAAGPSFKATQPAFLPASEASQLNCAFARSTTPCSGGRKT